MGEEKTQKILYAPEHIVQIFNIITNAEMQANQAASVVEKNQIWAKAIKAVAEIGDQAKPPPKLSSSIERFFSREKGDPRANELYKNLGSVHQKIEKSNLALQKTQQNTS